jgi:hypothetical protein
VREKFISATESEIQEMSSRSVDSVRLYGLPLKEQYSVVSEYVQYVFPYYRSLEEEVDPRGAELQEILLTHTLPQDETLYRRVSGSYADSLLNSKIGSEVSTGNFFASTSRDPLVAKHFGKGRGVTMVIKAPRGTKGGFVTDRGSEILLPANTVMRIDSLENDQIMLSVISQPKSQTDLASNIFCATGKGGGIDPTCTKEDRYKTAGAEIERLKKLKGKTVTKPQINKLIEKLSVLTVAQLAQLKRDYNLKGSGKKQDLINKLIPQIKAKIEEYKKPSKPQPSEQPKVESSNPQEAIKKIENEYQTYLDSRMRFNYGIKTGEIDLVEMPEGLTPSRYKIQVIEDKEQAKLILEDGKQLATQIVNIEPEVSSLVDKIFNSAQVAIDNRFSDLERINTSIENTKAKLLNELIVTQQDEKIFGGYREFFSLSSTTSIKFRLKALLQHVATGPIVKKRLEDKVRKVEEFENEYIKLLDEKSKIHSSASLDNLINLSRDMDDGEEKVEVIPNILPPQDMNSWDKVEKTMDLVKRTCNLLSSLFSGTEKIKVNFSIREEGLRAYYSPETKTVVIPQDADIRTIVHEVGHAFEFNLEGAQAACQDFRIHRTKLDPMETIDVDTQEYGKSDNFQEAWGSSSSAKYVGKFYPDKESITEILSMGLEQLVTNPVSFKRDREYLTFLTGLMKRKFKYEILDAVLIEE